MTEKRTMLPLKEMLERIEHCACIGDADSCSDIVQVTCDSREVVPGALFAAVRGFETDGHRYIDAATRAGAGVVVCEEFPESPDPSCFFIKVTNARRALAEASRVFYGDASDQLLIIGLTGTNGKTTTARLITAMLSANGISAGYIGTNLCTIGRREIQLDRTTPEAPRLHALFREMVDSGCRAAVMEVSSHALMLERVHGLHFKAAVFTNLTPEHLDFHGTMEEYGLAKQRLFEQLSPDGFAIVNGDDPSSRLMTMRLPEEKVFTCTLAERGDSSLPRNSFRARVTGMSVEGTSALVTFPDGERSIRIGLPGRFNVMNVLEACAVGISMGIPSAEVVMGVEGSCQVEGRMEKIWDTGRSRCAIVDYAHTPDALQKTLETLAEVKPPGTRLIVVFGCGGNRDRLKRPVMGAIASRYADLVFITTDNPRDEDPEAILDEIETGLTADSFRRITDRREAIMMAVREQRAGDVLLVAGKGHEKYQETKGVKQFFSDQDILRECLQDEARAAMAEGEH